MGLTTPGSDTGMFPNDPQMVLFKGNIRKGENVYLHKLPFYGPDGKPQFVQGGNTREFHSIPGVKGIKPVEIKAVPVDKYLNLIRQATPADLELQKKYMKQDVAEEQLDELKCWPGYSRVQGVPAGAPGSCKKKTNESSEDSVQIKYWQQDTQESGHWAKTKPMPRATAEKIVSSFPRGEIVDVEQDVAEGSTGVSVKKWAAQVRQEHGADTKFSNDKVHNRIIARKDKEIVGSYDRKANNGTVFSPKQDAEFNGDLDSKGRFTKDTVQKMFGKLSPDAKDIKEENCPHCAGPMFSEALMMEKKDACYYKVKSRYKVWPSAYASGALVKCRNKGAKNWGNKSESAIMRGLQSESLGTQYPSTYEEENEPFKRKGQRRIGTLTTEEKLDEKWSDKYKRSIDCSNPKGFSQRAHCQGKKKK
jgi:hypothetical protein